MYEIITAWKLTTIHTYTLGTIWKRELKIQYLYLKKCISYLLIKSSMKTLLKLFATLGSILFLSIFLLTIFTPQTIEKSAKNFIKTEIEDEVQKAIIREKIYSSLNLFLKKEKDKQFLSQIIADFVENEVNQEVQVLWELYWSL